MEDFIFYGHCRSCHHTKLLTLDIEAYESWQEGELIQNAFPQMSADDRELMISRTCGECWNKMFPENEEEIVDTF